MNLVHRRFAPAAAAAAVIAILLAGCSMGAGESSAPSVDMPAEMAPGQDRDQAVEDASGGAEQSETLVPDRSVITTGWVSITVADPVASAEDAADLAEQAGGRVDSRTETPGTDTQQPSAQLVLRIPSDELDGVVDRLRELGTVTSVSMNASDVTQQRQDVEARIEALGTSVDRLQQLLATATSITDLIAIESELTTRQAELDSLTQQRDLLVDQVDFSTVTVELVTEAVAPDARPDDFWSGVLAGWAALTAFASWLGVAFGVMLPWIVALLVIGAIAALVIVLATRSRRRPPTLPEQEPRA